MRFVLAFLAVMALLGSPLTAAAAQAACGKGAPSVSATMDMAAMPGMDQAGPQKAPANPCCDHTGRHKMSDKSCAQACATSCAVAAALPSSLAGITPFYTRAPVTRARVVFVHPYKPPGAERPPKSIA